MDHTENAYAAMLLTMALSPDREEYARPLSTPEFRRVEALARSSGFGSIGALLDVDISGLVMLLGLTEEEAYRVYTLLHRDVQLTYALGGFMADGIEVVTQYDTEYPRRLTRTLKESAPPFLYRCGNGALPDQPAIAVMGISGVRTTPEARRQIEALVDGATRQGYAVITGGELGVSRLAAGLTAERGGRLVDILGGGLREHLKNDAIVAMLSEGRASVLSTPRSTRTRCSPSTMPSPGTSCCSRWQTPFSYSIPTAAGASWTPWRGAPATGSTPGRITPATVRCSAVAHAPSTRFATAISKQ